MKKSLIPELAAMAAIAIFSGCIQEPAAPEAAKTGPTAPVQDDGHKYPSIISGDSLFDSETGQSYLRNPNRKIATTAQSALKKGAAVIGDQVDWAGWLSTRTYECTQSGYHVSFTCSVDPDYVVVGGGAYADYGSGPGALLTESRPLDDLTAWAVSSKDQVSSNYHTLHCYVIGLQALGMARATLIANMKVARATSGKAPIPEVGAGFINEDYVVVGGGSRVDWREHQLV
jgi:hypothetical protein